MANTPAEIVHLLEEIQAKDLQIQAFRDEINKRDAQLQKWVRLNGGHVLNPKEEAFSKTVNDCYDKCEILQAEKTGLSEKMLIVLDRQVRHLDVGLRGLSGREDFPSDWNGPSLLSGSATGVSTPAAYQPLQALSGNAPGGGGGGAPNIANAAQMRMAAQAAGGVRSNSSSSTPHSHSAPRAQREGSSEASQKRRRLNTSLGGASLPTPSSNLRQSSLGPGTPKAGTPNPTSQHSRAGSQQPSRPAATATSKKGGPAASAAQPNKKPPPTTTSTAPRKRDRRPKKGGSSLARRPHGPNTAATTTTATTTTSDADSISSTPPSPLDGADDGEGDEGPYCICQRGSFGEMVACDNDNCEFQWFHYECVGMKEQPLGEWLCPSCRKLPRGKIVRESQ